MIDLSTQSRPNRTGVVAIALGVAVGLCLCAVCGVAVLMNLPGILGNGDVTFKANASALNSTIVTPDMEAPIAVGKNVLYCSTFQLAWNELKQTIVKDDVRLQDEPPMVPLLNKSLSTRDDISDKDYVAMAGFGRDGIVSRINQALQAKFKGQAPTINANPGPNDFLAYAYLSKDLQFEKEFEKLDAPIHFMANHQAIPVKAFGLKEYDLAKRQDIGKQVSIYDYKDDSDFVLRFASLSANDDIVLAKVKPAATLLETIQAVQARIAKNSPDSPKDKEVLAVPIFDFDITRDYSELTGKPLTNKGFENSMITQATQTIRFRLNQKGALLTSGAFVFGMGAVAPPKVRHFVFDQPFLLYLQEKTGRYPYFVVWIDNPELMVKQPPE